MTECSRSFCRSIFPQTIYWINQSSKIIKFMNNEGEIYIIEVEQPKKDDVEPKFDENMLAFPPNTVIGTLRAKLKEVWPEFNFLNYQTKAEIFPVSETYMAKYIIVKKDSEQRDKDQKIIQYNRLRIRLLKNKEEIEKEKKNEQEKKTKENVKWALIKDAKASFTEKLRYNEKTKLSDLREGILSSKPDDSQDFKFLSQDGHPINKSSESNILVVDLFDKNKQVDGDRQISISFQKPPKEKVDKKQKKEQKEKIEKAQKTKKQVEGMIDELDEFQKQYKDKGNAREAAKEKKLKQLSDRLKQLDIPFTIRPTTDIGDVIRKLTEVKEENADFINKLQQLEDWTINQLAARYSNTICTSKIDSKIIKCNIVDFANSQFQFDWNLNTLVSQDFSYSTQQQQTNHIQSIHSVMNGTDIAAMGGNPFFFVKAGASYDEASEKKSSETDSSEYRSYFKNFFALFIGMGIKLVEDNIFIKPNVLKQFEDLLKLYDPTKSFSDEFKNKAYQFRTKYGTHLETGTYYLGNTFLAQVEVQFQRNQNLYMAQTVATTALDVSIAGGGITQQGFGAGSINFSRRTSQALSTQKEKFSQKFTTLTHNTSFPPIQNFEQWKKIVSTKNRYWKIITKKVSDVSILKLVASPKSLARSTFLSALPLTKIQQFSTVLATLWDRQSFTEQQTHTQFKDNSLSGIANKIAAYNSLSASRTENITIKQLSSCKTPILKQKQGLFDSVYMKKSFSCKEYNTQDVFLKKCSVYMAQFSCKFLLIQKQKDNKIAVLIEPSRLQPSSYHRMYEFAKKARQSHHNRRRITSLTSVCINYSSTERYQGGFGKIQKSKEDIHLLPVLSDQISFPLMQSFQMRKFGKLLSQRKLQLLNITIDPKTKRFKRSWVDELIHTVKKIRYADWEWNQ